MGSLIILLIPPTLLNALFSFRFLDRTLGKKHFCFPTLAVYMALTQLYGWANVFFGIAKTPLFNTVYFCLGTLALNMLLFHGGFLKKLFFTVLLECTPDILFQIFLPLNYAYGDAPLWSFSVLCIIPYIVALLQGFLLEYAGRGLQGLRNDLSAGYLFYSLLTVFVTAAATAMMDLSLYASKESPLTAALFGNLFAMAGMTVILFAVVSIDRQLSLRLAEQQAALQAAHYKGREEDWRRMARYRHDMKNHLLCLQGLLLDGKHGQAAAYLDTLAQAAARVSRLSTGNDFVDVILNEKYADALASGIAFTADMVLPPECRVAPMDLCCIFSNVLDNAIQACKRAEGESWIRARAFVRREQIVVEIKNSVQAGLKPGPFGRGKYGIGLDNVRRAVEKYGGVMELSVENCFVFSALLPMAAADPAHGK